eukprot:m.156681 g.156681  ORF g.156681 m.156681 type:complete len:233 (-) comp31014_c0_seq1:81-779(-)
MTTTTLSNGKRRRSRTSAKAPSLSLPSDLAGASSDQATRLLARCPTSDCTLCKKKLRICFLDVDSVLFMCTDEKCCFPIQSNNLRAYTFPWVPNSEEDVFDNTNYDTAVVGTTPPTLSASPTSSEQIKVTSLAPTIHIPATSIENLLGFDVTSDSFLVDDDSNLDVDDGTIDDTPFEFKLEDLETSAPNYPTPTSTTTTNTDNQEVKKEQQETTKGGGGWTMGDEDDWPGFA